MIFKAINVAGQRFAVIGIVARFIMEHRGDAPGLPVVKQTAHHFHQWVAVRDSVQRRYQKSAR